MLVIGSPTTIDINYFVTWAEKVFMSKVTGESWPFRCQVAPPNLSQRGFDWNLRLTVISEKPGENKAKTL